MSTVVLVSTPAVLEPSCAVVLVVEQLVRIVGHTVVVLADNFVITIVCVVLTFVEGSAVTLAAYLLVVPLLMLVLIVIEIAAAHTKTIVVGYEELVLAFESVIELVQKIGVMQREKPNFGELRMAGWERFGIDSNFVIAVDSRQHVEWCLRQLNLSRSALIDRPLQLTVVRWSTQG